MQSSESAGLPRNSIRNPIDSIEQGIRYLSNIRNEAESLGIEDLSAIFQAYNFGSNYLSWLANNDYKHSLDIAEIYSRDVVAPSLGNTTGRRMEYVNAFPIANGKTYRYVNGGNFHLEIYVMPEANWSYQPNRTINSRTIIDFNSQ